MSQLFVGFDINKNSTGLAVLNDVGELIMEDVFTGCKDTAFDSVEALDLYGEYFEECHNSLGRILWSKGKKSLTSINLFIEKPFVNSKMQDLSLFLARATGICAYIFCKEQLNMEQGFDCRWLNNKTLKKFITGSGNSSKIEVRNTIEAMYGKPEKMSADHRSDRADAISVAYMGLWCNHHLDNNKNLKKIPCWDNHLQIRQATALR